MNVVKFVLAWLVGGAAGVSLALLFAITMMLTVVRGLWSAAVSAVRKR